VTAGTTDQNGEAAATLTTPGDPTNRNITVTATAGKISATIVVAVVGTKIALTGPASLIQGATGTFNVSLTDSGGTGIAGATVTLASASSNTLSASSVVTNGTGQQTFTLTGTTAGSDTVTASALGLSATAPLTISNQSFAFTAPAPGTQVVVNTPIALAIKWTNAGAPVSGPVTFATSRGTITTPQPVTTAADGTATVMITSTTGGDTTVTASGAGVSAQLGLVFVATVAGAIDLQAGPDVIPTSGQSTVTATVTDGPTGNLVENATVDFTLTDATGGSLSVGTATTDVHGTAQTVYSATSAASSHNGVTITATVQGADCTTQPALCTQVSLTVGGQTVFLSLGTGSVVSENANKTQFSVPFVIQALDSAGNAVPGVAVSLTVVPKSISLQTVGGSASTYGLAAYAKGTWVDATTAPSCTTGWCQAIKTTCLPAQFSVGTPAVIQDVPGDVAAVSPGTVTTDSTGTANVNVTYPEDHALWAQVVLTATATVSGTQSSTISTFWLPMLAAYVTSTTQSPPGAISPYGVDAVCTDQN
jgi:hypothetical protein